MEILLSLFLAATPILAQDKQRTPYTGEDMVSSGTHCAGDLLIHPGSLTWTTVYSQCRDVPYRVLEYKQNGSDLHAVYQLKTHDPECRFRILVVDHTDTYIEVRGKGWNVAGFESFTAYRRNRPPEQLDCIMYECG